MSVKIRLARWGTKKRPYYRIVVSNSRSPRDGKYLEKVGTFNPMLADNNPDRVKLDSDRIKYWLGVGALPTERVQRFLFSAGLVKEAPVQNAKFVGMSKDAVKKQLEEEKAKADAEAKARAEAKKAAEAAEAAGAAA